VILLLFQYSKILAVSSFPKNDKVSDSDLAGTIILWMSSFIIRSFRSEIVSMHIRWVLVPVISILFCFTSKSKQSPVNICRLSSVDIQKAVLFNAFRISAAVNVTELFSV